MGQGPGVGERGVQDSGAGERRVQVPDVGERWGDERRANGQEARERGTGERGAQGPGVGERGVQDSGAGERRVQVPDVGERWGDARRANGQEARSRGTGERGAKDRGVDERRAAAAATQSGFWGRLRELSALREDIGRPGLDTLAGRVIPHGRVLLIAGRPGSGRTALAEELVRRLRDDYPDGLLRARLTTAGGEPVLPARIARDFLRALGAPVPPGADEEELSDRLRDAMRGRRAIVLLDDADSADQVELLLPHAPGSLVVAVAQGPLTGIPDVRPCTLGGLETAAAVKMLASVAGHRVINDPIAAETIVELCRAQPAALALVGGWLAARPKSSVAAAARELREVPPGDEDAADRPLSRAFRLAYGGLPPLAARILRLLVLAPDATVDAQSASALAGCSVPTAQSALEDFATCGLLRALPGEISATGRASAAGEVLAAGAAQRVGRIAHAGQAPEARQAPEAHQAPGARLDAEVRQAAAVRHDPAVVHAPALGPDPAPGPVPSTGEAAGAGSVPRSGPAAGSGQVPGADLSLGTGLVSGHGPSVGQAPGTGSVPRSGPAAGSGQVPGADLPLGTRQIPGTGPGNRPAPASSPAPAPGQIPGNGQAPAPGAPTRFQVPGCLEPLLHAVLREDERPAEVQLARARVLERSVRLLHACRLTAESDDPAAREKLAGLPGALRFPSRGAAARWLDERGRELREAARLAADDGQLDTLARRLVAALTQALVAHRGVDDAAPELYELHQLVLEVARRQDLALEEAAALLNLGDLDARAGRAGEALTRYKEALDAARAAADPYATGRALESIGGTYQELGDWQRAADWYGRALALHLSRRELAAEARLYARLGAVLSYAGQWGDALRNWRAAAAAARRLGDATGHARALGETARVQEYAGRPREALRTCLEALECARRTGDLRLQAAVRLRTADTLERLGDAAAAELHRNAAERLLARTAAAEEDAREDENEPTYEISSGAAKD
ncbi:tetratricopeptide repeat protein [Streptomyces sp. P1-3]|uniref:tetratricopeptide repeat protein n=1 Tax=Streptomyces sp. P1-3 TaxID=3421658 RepID=UPI003D36DDE5